MDIDAIRDQFPLAEKYINLDNVRLWPFPKPVIEAVEEMVQERAKRGVDAFWGWLDVADDAKALIAGLFARYRARSVRAEHLDVEGNALASRWETLAAAASELSGARLLPTMPPCDFGIPSVEACA